MEFEEIQGIEDAGAWCLKAHDVRFVATYFSRDRRRMLCLYEAPDAEAVRLAEKQAGVPFDRAWTCTRLEGNASGGTEPEIIVVERHFPAPVTAEFVTNKLKESGWCMDVYRAAYVESFLGADGLRMVCVFRAPDAESVRLANQKGGVPYTQVWSASLHRE